MRPPIPVIVNAASRAARNLDVAAVREAFAAHGRVADVRRLAPGDLDAALDALFAASPECVVAAGGDGTVNAVAARVFAARGCTLGVLPVGTLNHFARDLGLPDDLAAAAGVITAGHAREVDVGEVNGRVFLNNASLGLYPAMVAHRERVQRRQHLGKGVALLHAAWRALRRPHAFSVVLHIDGHDLPRRTPFVFVGNNDYVLEGPHAGERTTLDDGLLSVYVLRTHGTWGLIGLVLRALIGRVSDARDLEAFASRDLVVEAKSSRVRIAHDGEISVTRSPVRFRLHPRALRVFAPTPRAGDD